MTKRRKQTVLAKAVERSLTATPHEVALFVPDYQDILIAEAMLGGAVGWNELATVTEMPESTIRERLLDPTRCAWVSGQVSKAIEQRLGMVDAAVYAAALRTGDPARARFLAEKYKALAGQVNKNLHLHAHMDLTQLTTEELQAFIKDRALRFNVVDIKPQPPEENDSGQKESPRADT